MRNSRLKQDVVLETVREWISSGKYGPGEKLPPDVELSQLFSVNKCTVAAGLNRLVDEKILERAPGRGTIVRNGGARTNSVGLVTSSMGEPYDRSVMHRIDSLLQTKNLFPVLLDNQFAHDKTVISSFLERMVSVSSPYGFLVFGNHNFPYELIRDNPFRFRNIVFLLWYHFHEDIPSCRYVMLDFEDLARQIVEYFAERRVKKILFPALPEPKYAGPYSSLQVPLMQTMKTLAEKENIELDERLFWRTISGAECEDVLPFSLEDRKVRTGIFTWQDRVLLEDVDPALVKCGRDPAEFVRLGNFNTPDAKKNHLDSFDPRLDEIIECGFEMLTGKIRERKKLFSPILVRNSENKPGEK